MSTPKPSLKPTSRAVDDADKAAQTSDLEKIDARIKELRAFDVSGITDLWDSSLESLQKRTNAALADVLGASTPEYKKHALDAFHAELDTTFNNRYSPYELQQAFKESLGKAIVSLTRVKVLLNDRTRQQTPAPAPAPAPAPVSAPPVVAAAHNPTTAPSNGTRIAVVCHQEGPAREAASGFVAQLGLQVVTLMEPLHVSDSAFFNRLEVLGDLQFAVVILGPNALSPALLLELGFLMGTLGRARICFLVAGNMEMAPPWEGVVRLPMDEAGMWRLLLARTIKLAGVDVDMNRAL